MARYCVIALLIWSVALLGPGAVAAGSAGDAARHAGGPVVPLAPTTSGVHAITAVAQSSAVHPANPPVWIWFVVLAVTAGMVATARMRRPTVMFLLLLLTLTAFETGLHSVHHGADSDAAEQCAVASAWAQLSGLTVEPAQLAEATVAWEPVVGAPAPPHRPSGPLRTYEGRAPPSVPSI